MLVAVIHIVCRLKNVSSHGENPAWAHASRSGGLSGAQGSTRISTTPSSRRSQSATRRSISGIRKIASGAAPMGTAGPRETLAMPSPRNGSRRTVTRSGAPST